MSYATVSFLRKLRNFAHDDKKISPDKAGHQHAQTEVVLILVQTLHFRKVHFVLQRADVFVKNDIDVLFKNCKCFYQQEE